MPIAKVVAHRVQRKAGSASTPRILLLLSGSATKSDATTATGGAAVVAVLTIVVVEVAVAAATVPTERLIMPPLQRRLQLLHRRLLLLLPKMITMIPVHRLLVDVPPLVNPVTCRGDTIQSTMMLSWIWTRITVTRITVWMNVWTRGAIQKIILMPLHLFTSCLAILIEVQLNIYRYQLGMCLCHLPVKQPLH
jgi:hypothetical protein